MNIINNLNKSIRQYKNREKLDKILDLIDYFEIDESKAIIQFNKDILLINNGSTISVSKGYNITFAQEIHLNPNVPVSEIFSDSFVECLQKSKDIDQGCLTEPENTCLKKEPKCSHENHS